MLFLILHAHFGVLYVLHLRLESMEFLAIIFMAVAFGGSFLEGERFHTVLKLASRLVRQSFGTKL